MANTFYDVLNAAVADLAEYGFDSVERVAFWTLKLREAAKASMIPEYEMDRLLRERLADSYSKFADKGGYAKYNPGIERFTVEQVRPALRAELDRRIMASANLIKLNREAAIDKTIQRFQGWATSIPKGGTDAAKKGETKENIRKSLAQLPFEERRVLIDQGHKLVSSLSEILAVGGKAIAARWRHHHVTQPRPEHVARDGEVFLIRDSWAHQQGFVKPAGRKYTDDFEKPGFLVFCRCSYTYLYHLRDLPSDMLTEAGKAALSEARAKVKAMA